MLPSAGTTGIGGELLVAQIWRLCFRRGLPNSLVSNLEILLHIAVISGAGYLRSFQA